LKIICSCVAMNHVIIFSSSSLFLSLFWPKLVYCSIIKENKENSLTFFPCRCIPFSPPTYFHYHFFFGKTCCVKKRLLQSNATSKHNDIPLMSLRNYIHFLFGFQHILMHKCKSQKGFHFFQIPHFYVHYELLKIFHFTMCMQKKKIILQISIFACHLYIWSSCVIEI
jgi:hypothetical protein